MAISESEEICFLDEIIIEGRTESGQKFRPSDWVDRLCGMLGHFEQKRLAYSPFLRPMMYKNMQCVAIKKVLEKEHPEVYQFIMSFAKDNYLVITDCASFRLKVVHESA